MKKHTLTTRTDEKGRKYPALVGDDRNKYEDSPPPPKAHRYLVWSRGQKA
jgi:hypothetical protein